MLPLTHSILSSSFTSYYSRWRHSVKSDKAQVMYKSAEVQDLLDVELGALPVTYLPLVTAPPLTRS